MIWFTQITRITRIWKDNGSGIPGWIARNDGLDKGLDSIAALQNDGASLRNYGLCRMNPAVRPVKTGVPNGMTGFLLGFKKGENDEC